MTTASDLTERFAFESFVNSPDGYGGETQGYAEQFTVRAGLRHRNSGEEVMAARLAGTQTVVLTIRRSSQAEAISTDWRCRDVRSGAIYNIREVRLPPQNRGWVEILAQTGVA
ncbi:MAG: head-tail adaptor protein [Aurantimonas endophytica]|uniref:head-tail adaptor protein n=1 Tax=Aurantimonas endophytica TaxID=1522175 RepID=UPI0030029740